MKFSCRLSKDCFELIKKTDRDEVEQPMLKANIFTLFENR